MRFQLNIRMLLFLIILLSFKGCTSLDEPLVTPDSVTEIARDISGLIGEAEASTLSQCSIIGIGAKPCGGSWGFLVFSLERTDPERLSELVDRFNELNKTINSEKGIFSTCDATPVPETILNNGQCTGEGRGFWTTDQLVKFAEKLDSL